MTGVLRRFQNVFKRYQRAEEVAPYYPYEDDEPGETPRRSKNRVVYESDGSDEVDNINNREYEPSLPNYRPTRPRSSRESIRTPPQVIPASPSSSGPIGNDTRSPSLDTTPEQTIRDSPPPVPMRDPGTPPNLPAPPPISGAVPSIAPSLTNPNGGSLLNTAVFRNPNDSRLPFPVNPRSALVGFPVRNNQRPAIPLISPSRPFRSRFSSFRSRNDAPRYEPDYPIEDNRFRNPSRYSYDPPRRVLRPISEIPKRRYVCYFEEDPLPYQETFTYPILATPVYHYTAWAVPNDPMRIY